MTGVSSVGSADSMAARPVTTVPGPTSPDDEREDGERVTEPVIEARGLTKRFGGVTALDNVSLTVDRGQIRCVVGPNGAGKSTLFKVLAGIERPDSGSLRILGSDALGVGPRRMARRGLATKLQIPRVLPSLTVQEHLELAALATRGFGEWIGVLHRGHMQGVRRRVADLLELLELTPIAGRYAAELGHGERQWLEIGMMLATEPKVLLLDEPGAGMAVSEKARTTALLKRLVERTTLVVIEHDMQFVQEIAHNVLVMHRGAVLVEGPFDEIARHPEVMRVYLGSAAS